MKALYIMKWHRMAMIDDNFLSKIFFGFNCMISALIITVRITTQEYFGNYHYQAIRDLFGMHPGPIKELRPKIKFWQAYFEHFELEQSQLVLEIMKS